MKKFNIFSILIIGFIIIFNSTAVNANAIVAPLVTILIATSNYNQEQKEQKQHCCIKNYTLDYKTNGSYSLFTINDMKFYTLSIELKNALNMVKNKKIKDSYSSKVLKINNWYHKFDIYEENNIYTLVLMKFLDEETGYDISIELTTDNLNKLIDLYK